MKLIKRSGFGSQLFSCLIVYVSIYLQARANVADFPALKRIVQNYEFDDGTNVIVQASGVVKREEGHDLLTLNELSIQLAGKPVDLKDLTKLKNNLIGVRLETIQLFREHVGLRPEELEINYCLKFDYFGGAFAGDDPGDLAHHKSVTIRFNKKGVIGVSYGE